MCTTKSSLTELINLYFNLFVTSNVKRTPRDTIPDFKMFKICIPNFGIKLGQWGSTIHVMRGVQRGTIQQCCVCHLVNVLLISLTYTL